MGEEINLFGKDRELITIIEKTIMSVNKDVEKLEPSYIAGGTVEWCSHYAKIIWLFLKKQKDSIWSKDI